jgi:hypothetical protein
MACCPPQPSDRQAGYATPAALVFSLALALVCAAMTARSVQYLTLMRADIDRSQQEAALSGAHFEAAAEIVRSRTPGPYRWSFGAETGAMSVTAEPEADKLDLRTASTLPDAILAGFGVTDVAALKSRLAQAADARDAADVAGLDAAPLWRACGPSVASAMGQQDHFAFVGRTAPGPGPNPASWHIGESWRVRVATPEGWSDDRIVRFTGNAQRPAAIVTRTVARGGESGGVCDELLGSLFGG